METYWDQLIIQWWECLIFETFFLHNEPHLWAGIQEYPSNSELIIAHTQRMTPACAQHAIHNTHAPSWTYRIDNQKMINCVDRRAVTEQTTRSTSSTPSATHTRVQHRRVEVVEHEEGGGGEWGGRGSCRAGSGRSGRGGRRGYVFGGWRGDGGEGGESRVCVFGECGSTGSGTMPRRF